MTRYLSPWALAYIATILLVNIGFSYVHPIDIGFGVFSPMALVVGAIFIVRDFAQRDVGKHAVLGYMAVGLILSYIMAAPQVATASALAFIAAEGIDYLVYTYTKRPMRERVTISNAFSIPVDTAVFLLVAGFYSTPTFIVMVLSKLVATALLWATPLGKTEAA